MKSARPRNFRGMILICFSAIWAFGVSSPGPIAAQSHWGERKPHSFDEVRRGFSAPDMIYAPFIFWFWVRNRNSSS